MMLIKTFVISMYFTCDSFKIYENNMDRSGLDLMAQFQRNIYLGKLFLSSFSVLRHDLNLCIQQQLLSEKEQV